MSANNVETTDTVAYFSDEIIRLSRKLTVVHEVEVKKLRAQIAELQGKLFGLDRNSGSPEDAIPSDRAPIYEIGKLDATFENVMPGVRALRCAQASSDQTGPSGREPEVAAASSFLPVALQDQKKTKENRDSDSMDENTLSAIFDAIDTDGNGYIDISELRSALIAAAISPARVRTIMRQLDGADGDGKVDRNEWISALSGSNKEIIAMGNSLSKILIVSEAGKHTIDFSSIDLTAAQQHSHFMLRQASPFRLLWDCVAACSLIYIALTTPYFLGFGGETSSSQMIETILNYFFLADVVLNFRTGVIHRSGFEDLNWRTVGRTYIRSWFLLDLVSSLPLELLLYLRIGGNPQPLKLLKSGKIFKVVRLLKVGKVCKLCKYSDSTQQMADFIYGSGLHTLKKMTMTLVYMLFLCHFMACAMHWTGTGFLDNASNVDDKQFSRYVAAFYWAMTTVSTVGYGDLLPSSDAERLVTMVSMVFGGCFYGYVVGTLTSTISVADSRENECLERMSLVSVWIEQQGLPSDLGRRVRRYFRECFDAGNQAPPEVAILNDMSPELRNEVSKFLIPDYVQDNPIFDEVPRGALTRLASILQSIHIVQDEHVVEAGEDGFAMYTIVSGSAVMESGHGKSNNEPTHLAEGDSFGEEILLQLAETYSYTVIATTNLTCCSIHEDNFKECFANLPRAINQMRINFASMQGHSHHASRPHHKPGVPSLLACSARMPEDFAETVFDKIESIRSMLRANGFWADQDD